MHGGIVVGLGDLLQNLGLRDGFGEVDDLASDVGLFRGSYVSQRLVSLKSNCAHLFRSLQLHAHIGVWRWGVSLSRNHARLE